MKHLSTYFNGSYINTKEIEYDVRGFLTSLAKGHFSQFPDAYFISFSYEAIETGDGFIPFPQKGEGYLKREGDEWVIGTLVEKNQIQSFRALNKHFFNWLKESILKAYYDKAKEVQ